MYTTKPVAAAVLDRIGAEAPRLGKLRWMRRNARLCEFPDPRVNPSGAACV